MLIFLDLVWKIRLAFQIFGLSINGHLQGARNVRCLGIRWIAVATPSKVAPPELVLLLVRGILPLLRVMLEPGEQ